MQARANEHLHLVSVYVLLGEYKAYSPLVVVEGPPQNRCLCSNEEQSIIHKGWSVWKLPHKQHWEILSRNDFDRYKSWDQFTLVALAH